MLDAGHICTIDLKIGKDIIEIVEDQKINAGINLNSLEKVMKRFGKTPESLYFQFDDKRNEFIIKAKLDGKVKTFRLKNIDVEFEEFNVDLLFNLPLDSIFKMDVSDFLNAVQDCSLYSNIFTMKTWKDRVEFISENISGGCKISVDSSDIVIGATASYPISFCEKILKEIPKSKITVLFKDNYVMVIHLKISNETYLRYALAPQVEEYE